MALWCPSCDGHDYTPLPGGKIGFSSIEVLCDDCGHRYMFAVNIGAQLAREEEPQAQQGSQGTESEPPDPK